MQVERRRLGCSDHGANRNRIGIVGELVAATRTTRTANDVCSPQPQENLLDVIDRQTLSGSDVAAGDRTLRDTSRQVQRTDDAILGQSGNAHSWTL